MFNRHTDVAAVEADIKKLTEILTQIDSSEKSEDVEIEKTDENYRKVVDILYKLYQTGAGKKDGKSRHELVEQPLLNLLGIAEKDIKGGAKGIVAPENSFKAFFGSIFTLGHLASNQNQSTDPSLDNDLGTQNVSVSEKQIAKAKQELIKTYMNMLPSRKEEKLTI